MFSSKINITYIIAILLNVIIKIQTIDDEPIVENNNIANVEKVIRNTVNNLLSGFKIEKLKRGPNLKHHSTIHNFFVSITLQDWENLKELARLTRVKIDNNTLLFIAPINEVLHEDDKNTESSDTFTDDNVHITNHINMFIDKIRYLKDKYAFNNSTDVRTDILKYLKNHISAKHEASGNILSDNEIWKPNLRRIYNGMPSGIKRFPFIVSVQIFRKFHCAGSIIKNDLVITSASCLNLAWDNEIFRQNPSFLSVQIGSGQYDVGGDNIPVTKIIFHPEYNPTNLHNNLAIIRLRRKIIFRHHQGKVKKIIYDKAPVPLRSTVNKIIVIGWGSKDNHNVVNKVFDNRLSYAELESYPLMDCQQHYSPEFVTGKHFCAGYLPVDASACNRDTGGPGIVDGILMGIINFGSPICGAQASPTVFTKIGFYAEWIKETIDQEAAIKESLSTTFSYKTTYSLDTTTNTQPLRNFKKYPDSTTTTQKTIINKAKMFNDRGFKDFLNNMFYGQELEKYFDMSLSEISEIELENDQGSKLTKKEADPFSTTQSVMEFTSQVSKNPGLVDYPGEYPDETSNDGLSKEEELPTFTNGRLGVTVLDDASANEDVNKNLETGIVGLIDDLDMKEIIKSSNASDKNTDTGNTFLEIRIDVPHPSNDTNKEDTISTTPSSTSKESDENYDIEKQNAKILTQNNDGENPGDENQRNEYQDNENQEDEDRGDENREDGIQHNVVQDVTKKIESSAPTEFQDLTFREKSNDTQKPLSVSSLAHIISIAVDDESDI